MVRLTPELIQQSMQFMNPCRDRELSLRSCRIPTIENLGATLDQFDTIDFSDNDVRKLDGFPFLKRLGTLLFNNNNIVRIGENLHENIPNLETLILTGNGIQELSDLDPLSSFAKLRVLSLLNCPVSKKPHYREYVIYKIPQLKVLDFRKIKLKEKNSAAELFKSKKGKELQNEIRNKAKHFVPGAELPNQERNLSFTPSAQRIEEIKKIREAIAKATSLQEVERLQALLQAGHIPGDNVPLNLNGNVKSNGADVEQEDEEME